MLLSCLACPRVVTSLGEGIVCLDLNGGGGCSRRWCVANHSVLVDELLDESVRPFLPLGVEDDVLLLVEVSVLMLRESQGASAEED